MAVVDVQGAVLGRASTNIAKRLLNGESIDVVNSEHAIVTGSRENILAHYKAKRDAGGPFKPIKGPFYPRTPHMIFKRTVRGMLPYKKPHGKKAYGNLKVHIGIPKQFKGKNIEQIGKAIEHREYLTLGDISKLLGSNIEVKK